MVRLQVKRGDENQFLFDTAVAVKTDDLIKGLLEIYNARLKVRRVCGEIEEMAKHGTALPVNMVGLTEEQVEELKLLDEWGDICQPSGGFDFEDDPIGRRNGKKPKDNMVQILLKQVEESKSAISKKLVDSGVPLTLVVVTEQLNLLRGACTIVYPMNLPPHDPIRLEFEGKEDLGGTHDSLEVITLEEVELWFCGKQIFPGKQLMDFVGKNDKSKLVVKIGKKGNGPPSREPALTEDQKKDLMMYAYRRQQDVKRLEEDEDDSHLRSEWADSSSLKRSFQGLANGVSWKPR